MASAHPLAPRVDDPRLRRGRRFVPRLATAPLRALPDFLILGAMKAGTSSLFRMLEQHPQVVSPLRKEVHFFSLAAPRGRSLSWYRAHFPLRASLRGGRTTGEGTPDYVFAPGVPERIAALRPGLPVIMLLRDPVERAISHYFHEVRMGRETLPLEAALEAEEERLGAADCATPDGLELFLHASYKARGVYADQVERLFRCFGRDRVLLIHSEAFFADPGAHLARTCAFLGLAPMAAPADLSRRNVGRNRQPVPEAVRRMLSRHFAPHNERLYALIGERLGW